MLESSPPQVAYTFVIAWTLFALSAARRCPADGVVAGVKGEISTPHFPEYYPHRISCEWIIFVRNGYHVKLEFTHFDLEYCMFCKCDYVEIRDGRNSSAPLIGKFCESSRLGTIFSTGRYLWVKFYSDVGGRFQGFRAVYTAQKNGKTFKEPLYLSDRSGTFSSPKTSASCGSDRQCTWLVRAGRESRTRLTIYNISLPRCSTPCGCNRIQVRDGMNETSRLIAEFCHSISEPETMCSTTRHMWIRFQYGAGVDLTKHGFMAKYEEHSCGIAEKIQTKQPEAKEVSLDTVVGILCASFTLMALLTFFMVCIASRKLSRDRRKQRPSQTSTTLVEQSQPRTGSSPTDWTSDTCDSCVYHTHVHLIHDGESEYAEDYPRHFAAVHTPMYYCTYCQTQLSRPIAIL
ncbi:dorsal-ventral patterning tolloid-like protein 1 isoform X2 [Nematostella vectensis]|uniref:dorsal-ventral patterning tolloid-like protein 1 isoform X2 n=1 Tax=Nematostella vectensis TaxID=45351 RepID=UPI0020774E26|nr:dorsal-ventral patterning tolloid-like protein 1 isoform X2 [Nematostella vectensis]